MRQMHTITFLLGILLAGSAVALIQTNSYTLSVPSFSVTNTHCHVYSPYDNNLYFIGLGNNLQTYIVRADFANGGNYIPLHPNITTAMACTIAGEYLYIVAQILVVVDMRDFTATTYFPTTLIPTTGGIVIASGNTVFLSGEAYGTYKYTLSPNGNIAVLNSSYICGGIAVDLASNVFYCSSPNVIRICNLTTLAVLEHVMHSYTILKLMLYNSAYLIAAATGGTTVVWKVGLWDIPTQTPLFSLQAIVRPTHTEGDKITLYGCPSRYENITSWNITLEYVSYGGCINLYPVAATKDYYFFGFVDSILRINILTSQVDIVGPLKLNVQNAMPFVDDMYYYVPCPLYGTLCTLQAFYISNFTFAKCVAGLPITYEISPNSLEFDHTYFDGIYLFFRNYGSICKLDVRFGIILCNSQNNYAHALTKDYVYSFQLHGRISINDRTNFTQIQQGYYEEFDTPDLEYVSTHPSEQYIITATKPNANGDVRVRRISLPSLVEEEAIDIKSTAPLEYWQKIAYDKDGYLIRPSAAGLIRIVTNTTRRFSVSTIVANLCSGCTFTSVILSSTGRKLIATSETQLVVIDSDTSTVEHIFNTGNSVPKKVVAYNNTVLVLFDSVVQIYLVECALGYSVGASGCQPCLPGSYSLGSSPQCRLCEAGYYSPTEKAAFCLPCPQGTISGIGASVCTKCPMATYTVANSSVSCTKCPSGTFSNQPESRLLEDCVDCPPGSYALFEGSTSCFGCPAGTSFYGTGGRSAEVCAACEAGTYSNRSSAECSPCKKGMFSNVGAAQCSPCHPGTYSSGAASVCTPCPEGTYTITVGNSVCHNCSAGTFSEVGSIICSSCPAGTFSQPGSPICTPCHPGFFSMVASSSCQQCAAGTFTSSNGSSMCGACSEGTYSTGGAKNCSYCQPGTYAALPGMSRCLPCTAGTYSSKERETTCHSCAQGYVSNAENTECILCTNCNNNNNNNLLTEDTTRSADIVGSVVGAVVGVGVIVAVLVWVFIFRKKHNNDNVYIYGVKIMEKIGGGAFGEVYKGTWQGSDVALKSVKEMSSLPELYAEAAILKKLRHPNVVQFFGLYKEGENEEYIVTEFLSGGSVDKFLQNNRANVTTKDILLMAKGAAAGMLQLEERKIIHRDLAARNLLIEVKNGEHCVKVSDFGLSRQLENFDTTENSRYPIKWTAPEVLQKGTAMYSTKSDVWAYGVAVWEMLYCQLPYPNLTNADVLPFLLQGKRMTLPSDLPPAICNIITECWQLNPQDRPTFKEIFVRLSQQLQNNVTLQSPSSSSSSALPDSIIVSDTYEPVYI